MLNKSFLCEKPDWRGIPGWRARLLGVSLICLRSVSGQMVRQAHKNGLPGSHDVSSSFTHQKLDGEGYWATAEWSIYMAESFQELGGASARRAKSVSINQPPTVGWFPKRAIIGAWASRSTTSTWLEETLTDIQHKVSAYNWGHIWCGCPHRCVVGSSQATCPLALAALIRSILGSCISHDVGEAR